MSFRFVYLFFFLFDSCLPSPPALCPLLLRREMSRLAPPTTNSPVSGPLCQQRPSDRMSVAPSAAIPPYRWRLCIPWGEQRPVQASPEQWEDGARVLSGITDPLPLICRRQTRETTWCAKRVCNRRSGASSGTGLRPAISPYPRLPTIRASHPSIKRAFMLPQTRLASRLVPRKGIKRSDRKKGKRKRENNVWDGWIIIGR